MYEIGKVLTSRFVGTGPSSYKKRIYRFAVSQRMRNTNLYYSPTLMMHGQTQNQILIAFYCNFNVKEIP